MGYETSRCPNCSAASTQEYCPQCGQRRIQMNELSARHFVKEAADEITKFRTRFKTLATLKGLLVPGFLTAEYLAGRRQRYLTPLKTYLVCAAIFFLAAPVAGFTLSAMLDADQSGVLRRLASTRAAERHLDPPLLNARFDAHVQSGYTITLGAVAILFAVMLQLLFRKEHWPFWSTSRSCVALPWVHLSADHCLRGQPSIGLSIDAAALGGYALLLPYVIVALKRVYADSNAAVALKGAVLLVLTIAFNTAVNFVAIRLTLALV